MSSDFALHKVGVISVGYDRHGELTAHVLGSRKGPAPGYWVIPITDTELQDLVERMKGNADEDGLIEWTVSEDRLAMVQSEEAPTT